MTKIPHRRRMCHEIIHDKRKEHTHTPLQTEISYPLGNQSLMEGSEYRRHSLSREECSNSLCKRMLVGDTSPQRSCQPRKNHSRPKNRGETPTEARLKKTANVSMGCHNVQSHDAKNAREKIQYHYTTPSHIRSENRPGAQNGNENTSE